MAVYIDEGGNSFHRDDPSLDPWEPEVIWKKLPHARWETAVVACELHNSEMRALRKILEGASDA